jgi:FAD/FMN-containing dehydrogenase
MPNNPNPGVASSSAPAWENWSGNLLHKPPTDGGNYYFMPANLTELRAVLAETAKVAGATLRVSGQRHSQPPLVIGDNRDAAPSAAKAFLVEMSCYRDLGPGQDQNIVLGPGANKVTVNTGVREDELDAFLTSNNLMLRTVTAGGFFSIGGMTAVDVHGGTVDAPIFAETVSAFNLVRADGSLLTIDDQSPAVGGWSPLRFARVSLGGLGIVTSVTIDVLPRPYATSLQGGSERLGIADKPAFVDRFQRLLENHARLEIFFTAYATSWVNTFPVNANNFLVLWWDVVSDPPVKTPNRVPQPYPKSACSLATQPQPEHGAPGMGSIGDIAESLALKAQYADSPGNTWSGFAQVDNPAAIAAIAFYVIEKQVAAANASHSELWLTESAKVIFMSYYIPLPDLKAAGLCKVWEALDVVARIITQDGNFHIALPVEFRFIKGGDSAMSGAYSDDPNTWFLNVEYGAFVDRTKKASDYPPKLLKFFADVERQWVSMKGIPHTGKMYGFYDPAEGPDTYSKTGPFNPNFLASVRAGRGARLGAFNAYRQSLDPNGLFYNNFLRQMLEQP